MEHHLVIVEDEPIVRQGLAAYDWNAWGFQMVGSFATAQAAWAWLSINAVDVVLTDIRMPGMDGIALCEKVREILPNALTIVLSGYNEFALAQQALKAGVFDYLLKPLDEQESAAVWMRAKAALARQKRETVQLTSLREESWLRNQLFGMTSDEQSERSGLILPDPYYVAVLEGWGVEQIAASWILKAPHDRFLAVDQGRWALILDVDGYEWFQQRMATERIRVGLSRIATGVAGLASAYSQAREALARNALPRLSRPAVLEPSSRLPQLLHQLGPIIEAARTLRREAWDVSWEYLLIGVAESGLDAKSAVQFFSYVIYQVQEATDHQWSNSDSGRLPAWDDLYHKVEDAKTPDATGRLVRDALWQRLEEMANAYHRQREHERLAEVLGYIAGHFATDLSITTMAAHFNMSVSAFSRWFKEVAQVNYIDYLTYFRIEQARRWLETTKASVAVIASHVGYADPRYFGKVFKRTVGLTPSQYRSGMVPQDGKSGDLGWNRPLRELR